MLQNIETLNAPSDRTFSNKNWAYIRTNDKFDRPVFWEESLDSGGKTLQFAIC